MCAGGIAIAGIAAVVHAVTAEQAAAFAGHGNAHPSRLVYQDTGADVQSLGPVLPEAGAAVHRDHR